MTTNDRPSTEMSCSTRSKTNGLPPKPPVERAYSGMIRSITIPLSIGIPGRGKWKTLEMQLCFSNLKSNVDHTAKIKKEFNALYKHGTHAPGTHLIPMTIRKRESNKDDFVTHSYTNYGMPCGPLPGTATIWDIVDFFPCHEDVLPMMLKQYDYPDFYITLLRYSAVLNIKTRRPGKNTYQCIPMKHNNGKCRLDVGFAHIHIFNAEKKNIGVSRYSEIKWDALEFEMDGSGGLSELGVRPFIDFE